MYELYIVRTGIIKINFRWKLRVSNACFVQALKFMDVVRSAVRLFVRMFECLSPLS